MNILSLLLLAIIPGLIIAIVTAYITVQLSLKQFYSEQWWQQKATAYSEIILALFHIKQSIDIEIFKIEEGIEFSSDERQKELGERSASGYETINKAVAYGSFAISDEASDCISKFNKEIRNPHQPGDWFDAIQKKSKLIEKCINQIREYAKRDLRKK